MNPDETLSLMRDMLARSQVRDLDALLTVEEFAQWIGQSVKWVKMHPNLPGRIQEGQKVVRFHPRTYLSRRLRISQ